jgi:hypothetical protein
VYPSQGRTVQGVPYEHGVVLSITSSMEGANPLFRGCMNYDA